MNKQPGAQFEILVDGKPRSYRDTKSGAMDAVQEPTAAQRGCGERPAKRAVTAAVVRMRCFWSLTVNALT